MGYKGLEIVEEHSQPHNLGLKTGRGFLEAGPQPRAQGREERGWAVVLGPQPGPRLPQLRGTQH